MVHEPSVNPTAQRSLGKLEGKTPLAVFLVLALAIGTVGYAIFAHFEDAIRQEKYHELGTIGDLKVSQIVGWLGERRGDAAATTRDPILAREVQRWLQHGAPHDEAARRIESRLQGLREAYGYDKVILLDRGGRQVLVAGDALHQHAHAESNRRAAEVMSAGQPLLSDLHLDAEADGAPAKVNIDLYAPLLEVDRRIVGTVYFQIDPHRFLFPFVQSWPTASRSAESLLVRRDGDDVLYLNELRHRKDSALRFRLPLNTPDLPAAKALRGETGVVKGVDYRGVPVLAALRTIPGTSWYLVAKIDRAEVFAPTRNLAIGVGAIVAVLIAGAGLLTTLWWRRQHAQVLAMHFKAEFEREALSKHLDLMSRHANDAIFLYDEAGRILEANERAVERYGYPRAELIGMSAKQLRAPKTALAARAEATLADQAGSRIYEALHRRKDGGEFPVEASLRVIDVEGRRLTQGIIRDISERKRSELALRESEVTYRSLVEKMLNGFAYCRMLFENGQPRDFVYLSVNDAFGTQTGLKDVVGRKVTEVIPGIREADPELFEIYGRVAMTGQPERFEIFVEALQNWFSISVYSPKPEHFVAVFDVVTERKRADATLRDSEERYRVIAESASDVILAIDEDSRIRFTSPAVENMFGYVGAELIGQPLTILIPEDLRSAHLEALKRYVDTGRRSVDWKAVELRGRHKSGTQFPVEIAFGEYVRDGKRAFAGFIRDITERKRAEARIERLARLKDALSGVNHAIVHAESEQPLFDEICSIMVRRAGFDGASIGIADTETGDVKWVAWAGAAGQAIAKAHRSVRADRPEGRGPTGTAIREGRHIVYQDFVNDPSTAPWHTIGIEFGIGSTASFPILRAGKAVGVINVDSRARNAFDDEMVALLDEAAQDVSFALDNLDREGQRKHADERIRRLNRIYALLSGINSAIVRVSDREELFSEACRIAVEAGNFPAAWVGVVDRKANTVQPVAWHGLDSEYIRAMPVAQIVASEGVTPEKVGLAPLAIAERKPMVSVDMATDPRVMLKKEALDRGFRSLVVLPLLVGEEVVGVLALYAGEVGFFDEEEMKLLNELAGDISFALDHIEKASKLDYLVFYDQLTGLANRALFLEQANQSIRTVAQAGGKFALAILDIERLRTINESLGRQAGDALIKQVAERLKIASGASGMGRIGADHFALVLDAVKGRSHASRIVRDVLQKCFGEPFQVSDTELRLSAKSGVALFPGDGADSETLLRNAEAALRKAKELRERYVFYTPALTERTAERLTLENRLRQALEKDEFVLHYQPKVDLETRGIVGVEALIRWQSPELGLVPPGKFIPLMEETGLILDVGSWALRRAAIDHRSWFEQRLQAPRIAVNISAIQLRQRDFVGAVEQVIMEGIAPTGIDLEITESLVMDDIEGNIKKLKEVRGLGIGIAVDDFGTGYSSLGYLAKLPVHTLKIDRSFIITMLNDPDTMTLVQTMISLAHSLKLTVVAEGVEQEEQAKMLRLLRCDQMQGYLFSRPVPFDQMTAMLKQGNNV